MHSKVLIGKQIGKKGQFYLTDISSDNTSSVYKATSAIVIALADVRKFILSMMPFPSLWMTNPILKVLLDALDGLVIHSKKVRIKMNVLR